MCPGSRLSPDFRGQLSSRVSFMIDLNVLSRTMILKSNIPRTIVPKDRAAPPDPQGLASPVKSSDPDSEDLEEARS